MKIEKILGEIADLAKETGLDITEFKRIVQKVQKGERDAGKAKKEMVASRSASAISATVMFCMFWEMLANAFGSTEDIVTGARTACTLLRRAFSRGSSCGGYDWQC